MKSFRNNWKVAVIGAGEIGSRHLQSLGKFEEPLDLFVVDPSLKSIEIAQERLSQTQGKNVKSATFLKDISLLKQNLDLAIISTNSNIREAIITKIVNTLRLKYLILEKVVFQRNSDFKKISELLRKNSITTWVNCPRRSWKIYKELNKKLRNSQNLEIKVSGSNLGIASNLIHFIDLFNYFAPGGKIKIKTDMLDKKIIKSKRKGFLEFTGTIQAIFSKEKSLSVTSYSSGDSPVMVNISSDLFNLLISERTGDVALFERNRKWSMHQSKTKIPLQSELTHLIVREILNTGKSELTTYEESRHLHRPMLNAFITFLNAGGRKYKLCPIT